MSDDERDERKALIRETLWEFFYPYFVKAFIGAGAFGILSAATIFSAGIWANSIHENMAKLLQQNITLESSTHARIASWTTWRETVEDRLRAGMADRFTGTDWDTASFIFNMKGPNGGLPTLREIRKEQGRP